MQFLPAAVCIAMGGALVVGAATVLRLDWSEGGPIPSGPACRDSLISYIPLMEETLQVVRDSTKGDEALTEPSITYAGVVSLTISVSQQLHRINKVCGGQNE